MFAKQSSRLDRIHNARRQVNKRVAHAGLALQWKSPRDTEHKRGHGTHKIQ